MINRTHGGNAYGSIFRIAFGIVALVILMAAYTGEVQANTCFEIVQVSTSPESLNPQPTGGGTYVDGETVTVTAQTVTGYTFQEWTENGVQVSTSMSYSFTATCSGIKNLVAVYASASTTPTPTSISTPHKPVFVYPTDGASLDYEGAYSFKVEPIDGVQEFLWGFFQNGKMVWENYRDEEKLSSNEYVIRPETTAHSKFTPGKVEVWVRASFDGQWTDAAIITINLQSITPNPKITVESPNGGENLHTGDTYVIEWSYTGNPGDKVKIDLLKNGKLNKNIASKYPIGKDGGGTYNWVVPSRVSGTDYKIRITSITNSAYTDTSNGDFDITPNTFYPGINWKKKNLDELRVMAFNLDSALRKSYMGTGVLDGALHTWLAYKGIKTQKNYLLTDDGDSDSTYPIAFAHSGGTQTLIRKIEDKKVKAKYVVLAAPALLSQSRLEKLVENGEVKKIVIIQSPNDILNQLKVRVERQHVFGGGGETGTNPIQPGIIVKKPLAFNGLAISIGPLLAQNNLSIDIIPAAGEEFWIGGASRAKQKLFEEHFNSKGEKDIITINEDLPDIPKISDNPLLSIFPQGRVLQIFGSMYGVYIHGRLRDKMIEKFVKGESPFDGRYNGLKKIS